jgi:hypothetical protein
MNRDAISPRTNAVLPAVLGIGSICEIKLRMLGAARVKRGATMRAAIAAAPVFLDRHLISASAAEHRRLSPFRMQPDFDRMAFIAKLTVTFPGGGKLQILNAASPVSARRTRLFVPLFRNFNKDGPIEQTLDFNYQVFAEGIEIVETQYPEDLPLNLHDEAHFPADRSSVTYRKGLAALGLGSQFTA